VADHGKDDAIAADGAPRPSRGSAKSEMRSCSKAWRWRVLRAGRHPFLGLTVKVQPFGSLDSGALTCPGAQPNMAAQGQVASP